MKTLVDKNGETTGYVYNNVILLPEYDVAGVILAHCVFTRNGHVRGKFFGDHIHNERGEIIARENKSHPAEISTEMARKIMIDAWKILSKTKDYLCPWVTSTGRWSNHTLEEFLSQ